MSQDWENTLFLRPYLFLSVVFHVVRIHEQLLLHWESHPVELIMGTDVNRLVLTMDQCNLSLILFVKPNQAHHQSESNWDKICHLWCSKKKRGKPTKFTILMLGMIIRFAIPLYIYRLNTVYQIGISYFILDDSWLRGSLVRKTNAFFDWLYQIPSGSWSKIQWFVGIRILHMQWVWRGDQKIIVEQRTLHVLPIIVKQQTLTQKACSVFQVQFLIW